MSEITHLIDAAAAGDRQAAADLLPLVYDELRKLAAARMAAEKPGHTLNATALVHEAYLRLVGDQQFGEPGTLLRGRGGSDAANPGQPRPRSQATEASRRARTGRASRSDRFPRRRTPTSCCRSMSCSPVSERKTPPRRGSLSFTSSAGSPSRRRARPWVSPGRSPTGTGSTREPGSARRWKNNSECARHFSPGWGIESRSRRLGRQILTHPGGEPWPSMPHERNPFSWPRRTWPIRRSVQRTWTASAAVMPPSANGSRRSYGPRCLAITTSPHRRCDRRLRPGATGGGNRGLADAETRSRSVAGLAHSRL